MPPLAIHRNVFSSGLMVSVLLAVFLPALVSHAQKPILQKPGSFTGQEDIMGWVMSEKLDGIRGYWDGRRLMTRKGHVLNPPQWFLENFPGFELDGELWSRQGDFEFIQSVVLDKVPGRGWEKISYNIFEVPNQKGDFFSRLALARDWFLAHPNTRVRVIDQILIKDPSDLDRFFNQVEARGGEGVIVKDPYMPYHTGRSGHVLKVKKAKDMEGKVMAINPGKGKYENLMGSLTIRLENGIVFRLGTGFTDKMRKNPPPVGSVVTFKYHGLSKNRVPKFASFLRIRRD